MRQQKKLEGLGPNGDKTITIKEASVEYILSMKDLSLFGASDENINEKGLLGLIDLAKPVYEELTEGLPFSELKDLFPSELELIGKTFKEVNSVFFDLVQKLGLSRLLDEILQEIKSDFTSIFADFSKEVIQEYSITELDGS